MRRLMTRPRVLIACGTGALAEEFASELGHERYELDSALTIDNAVAHILDWPDALLIASESLQDGSGEELIGALKDLGLSPPFIALTSPGNESSAAAMLRLGALALFVKGPKRSGLLPLIVRKAIQSLVREAELAQAAAAMQEYRELCRLVMETSPDAILVTGLDGTVRHSSSQARLLLGNHGGELEGCELFSLVDELDRERASSTWDKCLDSGTVRDICLRFTTLDGRSFQGEVSAAVTRDSRGAPEGYVVVVRNVDAREQMEMESRHAQKLEAIGQLTSGIAHEINTPLQYMGNSLEFLGESCGSLLDLLAGYRRMCKLASAGRITQENMQCLRDAEASADADYLAEELPAMVRRVTEGVSRVSDIVQAMQRFAHPDRMEKSLVDVNEGLRSTLLVARNAYKYSAKVVTELGELPLVPCSPGPLNQVFLNLIVNATHAIQERLGDSGLKGVIRLRSWAEEDSVVISVSDTGCGIRPELGDRVFEPFFTTKGQARGTGQGLAISRCIVEKHGGQLTFESEVGKGTAFFVRLPAAGPLKGQGGESE